MSTYDEAPMTAAEAKTRSQKRRAKEKNAAQEKSAAYSRLVANKDFALFLENVTAFDPPRARPMTDFEQGRMSLVMYIIDELSCAAGAAKLFAGFTEKRLEAMHKQKVFRMEQKEGDE
jgi:hypothetical protein